MSILCLLEVTVKPESVEEFVAYMKKILPDTRTYSGCLGVDLQGNQDDANNFVAVEEWETRDHHQKYVAWRTETGVLAHIVSMLSGAPSVRYFDKADA